MSSRYHHVYLLGIGGINVSGAAKLLRSQGIPITGYEDDITSEVARDLIAEGVTVRLGATTDALPAGCDLVVYSSALPQTHPERQKAVAAGIRSLNSHVFFGEWFRYATQVVVSGTHGKSTTTSMLAMIAIEAGLDPNVVIGTKLATLPDKNIRIGQAPLFIVEGDEYAHHFLEFTPTVLVITTIELDHVDLFPTIEVMRAIYARLIGQMRANGTLIVEKGDVQTDILLTECANVILEKSLTIVKVNPQESLLVTLQVPGAMNVQNAALAAAAARALDVSEEVIHAGLTKFPGIWRRFERIGEKEGVTVISDYGHHPTAIRVTLEAAKSLYPDRRIVLCFQPHHRNRTRHLFLDFVPSFDLADELILVEIYDVIGRDQHDDEEISSQDLCDAIHHHDADRGVARTVTFATDDRQAKALLLATKKTGDVLIVMGAGSIYKIASELL